MEQNVAVETPELINLSVRDWEGTRRAHLEDVPRNATAAEIVDEARRLMGLASDTSYHLVLGSRALNGMQTLEEAGVESEAELEILPRVQAG
jgi:hypothetical protein